MADRPIIFSGPMVRALLDGRKTQTRRVLNPQPQELPEGMLCKWHIPGKHVGFNMTDEQMHRLGHQFAPYAVCDRLYVREAWAPLDALTHNDPGTKALADRGFYRADESTVAGEIARWRPSIHMPRWASRLTLTVTEVRVQRLQDITRGEAMEEGCPFPNMVDGPDPRAWFRDLWNDLHDKGRGHTPWWENPWVVALTFTVQHGNIDQLSQSPTRGGTGPGPS